MPRFLAERTDSLETLVKTTAEQSNTAARADKSELHEAVVKLAANQQTLADTEQWRAEAEGVSASYRTASNCSSAAATLPASPSSRCRSISRPFSR